MMPFDILMVILAAAIGAVWGFYFKGWKE